MTQQKMDQLTEIEGFDEGIDMLEECQLEGSVPCICMNPDCKHVEYWEPDTRNALCGECKTYTVTSCMELAIDGYS